MVETSKKNKFFVIDFDSTFVRVETLDELAAISLYGNKNRGSILKEIRDITTSGMEGKISIEESLEKRVVLLSANKNHLADVVKLLKKNVTPSFARNRKFLKKNARNIFILSAGFKNLIVPVVSKFGILEENVFANDFIFDNEGNIIGFDKENLLAKKGGKVSKLKELKLHGDVYAIGDGYTDYELKESGAASKFFAFTENVARSAVTERADYIAQTFDEFLRIYSLMASE